MSSSEGRKHEQRLGTLLSEDSHQRFLENWRSETVNLGSQIGAEQQISPMQVADDAKDT